MQSKSPTKNTGKRRAMYKKLKKGGGGEDWRYAGTFSLSIEEHKRRKGSRMRKSSSRPATFLCLVSSFPFTSNNHELREESLKTFLPAL